MNVQTVELIIRSNGYCDVIDITGLVSDAVGKSELDSGTVTVFVPGSTAAVTTIEYESGAISDFKSAIERIVPEDLTYAHDARWGDGNGFSHVRAAMLGPSLCVPFNQRRILLGTWQQIVFVDFDNRPRNRNIVLQLVGS